MYRPNHQSTKQQQINKNLNTRGSGSAAGNISGTTSTRNTHKNLQSAEGTRNINKKNSNLNTQNSKNNNPQSNQSLQINNNSSQFKNAGPQGDLSYEGINNVIHEYLLKNGMPKTLEVFQQEMQNPVTKTNSLIKSNSGNFNTQQNPNQFQKDLMNQFDKGNREDFFKKWNKYIPLNIRQKDEKTNKLEFYLQIYFYIYQIHPVIYSNKKSNGGGISKENQEYFKTYLENRGKELSKTSEFLQFYALPYIDKPQEHIALKHMFEEEWINDLREKLIDFFKSIFPEEEKPLIFQMYQIYLKYSNEDSGTDNNQNQNIQQQQQMQQRELKMQKEQSQINYSHQEDIQSYKQYIGQIEGNNQELLNVIQEFNIKYTNLQKNYRQFADQAKQNLLDSQTKWFQVAQDLVLVSRDLMQMIEQNQNTGEEFQKSVLDSMQKKLQKYESFLQTNIEDLIHQSQDYSIFDKISLTENPDNSIIPLQQQYQHSSIVQPNSRNELIKSQIGQNGEQIVDSPYIPLNYDKIKDVFVTNQDPILCCAILQALKQRITKTKGAYIRREVVISYATFDIIGCKNINFQQELLLGDKRVQEFVLRLVNSMASDYHGRSYLVESDNLVKLLIHILRTEKQDTPVRRNSLGALQKLSLRRRPQIVMIENDLIQWIVDTLNNDRENLSEYSYEYATALFMNLSLRSLGKEKCLEPLRDVLNVLKFLLEHENAQVRTFVNGTLYSLLSKASIRQEALNMNFNIILSNLMENSDERFKKQLQYIIDQLNRSSIEEDEGLSETEEDNDVDDIEDEEDMGEEDEEEIDEIIYADNLLIGEELLIKEYALSGQEAIQQNKMTKSIIDDVVNKKNQSQLLNVSKLDRSVNNNMNNPDLIFNRPQTPMSVSQVSYNNTQNNGQQGYQHHNNKFQRIDQKQNQIQQQLSNQNQQYQVRLTKQQLEQQKSLNYNQQNQYQQQLQQQGHNQQGNINNNYSPNNYLMQNNQHQNQQQNYIGQNQNQQYQNQIKQMQNNQNVQNNNNIFQNNNPNNIYNQQQNQFQDDSYLNEEEQQNILQNNQNYKYQQQINQQQQEFQQQQRQQLLEQNFEEYQEAFSSAPKIPRTPPAQVKQEEQKKEKLKQQQIQAQKYQNQLNSYSNNNNKQGQQQQQGIHQNVSNNYDQEEFEQDYQEDQYVEEDPNL